MNDDKGPIELLCKEIGAVFIKKLETPGTLVAFVQVQGPMLKRCNA